MSKLSKLQDVEKMMFVIKKDMELCDEFMNNGCTDMSIISNLMIFANNFETLLVDTKIAVMNLPFKVPDTTIIGFLSQITTGMMKHHELLKYIIQLSMNKNTFCNNLTLKNIPISDITPTLICASIYSMKLCSGMISAFPPSYDENKHWGFISEGWLFIPLPILVTSINDNLRGIRKFSQKDIMKDLADNNMIQVWHNNGRNYNTHHIYVSTRPDICKQRFVKIDVQLLQEIINKQFGELNG